MTSAHNEETRPRPESGARFEDHTGTSKTNSDSTPAPAIPVLTAGEITASRPCYVLVVKTPSDRITRRVFLSLHAAVKATERSEARGHAAHLELLRLVPYLTGAELHQGVAADA